MAESPLTDLVKSIQDSQSALIKMRKVSGQLVHLRCVYKESVAPNFFVVFPPGALPNDLDTSQPCDVSVHDNTGASIALTARIVEMASDRSLELKAATAIDPASLREYFRINLRTAITISFQGTKDTASARNWSLKGQTIDISACGVLALFPDEPRNKHNIFIQIILTYPEKSITCTGHVVRTNRLRGGNWQVALHFDTITDKDRDAVTTNCLWEQRRQLREKIQVAD